jgi:hypothetical protein
MKQKQHIGYTFIITSSDDGVNTERYMFDRIFVFRNLSGVFAAIDKEYGKTVTYTIDVGQFIRTYDGKEFTPKMVGYIGDISNEENVIVKCVYGDIY